MSSAASTGKSEYGERFNGEVDGRWNTNMLWKWAISLGCFMGSAATILAVVLYFIVAGNQNDTNAALCKFHEDLGTRIVQTQEFLAHPQEAPSFDDPQTLALVRNQLDNQLRTYESLTGLPCDPVEPQPKITGPPAGSLLPPGF